MRGDFSVRFEYKIRDPNGNVSTGITEGDSKQTVIEMLNNQDFLILHIKPVKKGEIIINVPMSKKIKNKEMILFSKQFALMLDSGLSITSSLAVLAKQNKNKYFQSVLSKINEDIESGSSLYESLKKYPTVFSSMYANMVKSGEVSGNLSKVLYEVAEHLDRNQQIASKVKSASIYPIILSVLSIVVVAVLLVFVFPMFTEIFESSNTEMPAPTQFLIGLSDSIRSGWLSILLVGFVLFFGVRFWLRSSKGKVLFDIFKLKIPVLSNVILQVATANFTRTMGTLLRAGVPIITALEIVEDVMDNTVIKKAISNSRISILGGQDLSGPLVEANIFDPLVTQMIMTGEETGRLEEVCVQMSEFYDKEVQEVIGSSMAILEPLLIVIIAIVIGGLVISIFLPMFNLSSAIG